MKKKLVFAFVFLFIGVAALSTRFVLAETGILSRVTTACESKIGGVLMGIDDGFSSLKSCPGNSRKVILGVEQKSGNVGGNVKIGKVRFVADDPNYSTMYIMNDEGKMFELPIGPADGVIRSWANNPNRDLPSDVSVDDLVYWSPYSFMTVSGDTYYADADHSYNGWIGPFAAPIQ